MYNILMQNTNIDLPFTDQMVADAKQMIDSAQTICLNFHPSPDGDSYGSALGMAHALRAVGKTVTVYQGDLPPPRWTNIFPGYETVVQENIVSENLAKHDLYITVDSATPTQICKEPGFTLPDMPILVIDHHHTERPYGTLRLVDVEVSSCAELIFYLLPKLGLPLTSDTATCLYMGMYSDTVGLRINDVTEKTVSAMAQCYPLTTNIQPRIIASLQNYGRKELDLISVGLTKREYVDNNRLCLIILNYNDILNVGLEKPTTYFITSFLAGRMYDAKNLCVAFETTPNNFRVSARSDSGEHDVSYDMNLFMNKLGGGGHKGSAGALFVAETPDDARAQILKAWSDTQ